MERARASTSQTAAARRAGPRARRVRVRLTALCAALIAGSLAACGSGAKTTTAKTPTATSASAPAAAPARLRSVQSQGFNAGPAHASRRECAQTDTRVLAGVASRVYREAATGGDVEQAAHRVRSSRALAGAIAGGDASAAGAALRGLALNQITGVEVLRGGRVFASAGSAPSLAPVRGAIPGTGASFVLSVQSDADFLQVVRQITGAQVALLSRSREIEGTGAARAPAEIPASGATTLAGTPYEVGSLSGERYPSGSLRVALLVPAHAISCAGSAREAYVEALGRVGERIYAEERAGAQVAATQRLLEGSRAFQMAVAARSAAATRTAIVGFFRAHIHVVRVRVTVGGRLLVDVGGPYVLAPVHGTLRMGGRTIGEFEWAIQDDAGYEKLAHLFTGAQVLMRTGAIQVMGTFAGPASLPSRGAVSYGGRTYGAFSFAAQRFPSGALRISLLVEEP